MSPKKKDEVLPVNPLYAVGGKPKPMTQDEIASAFAPDEEEEQIEEPKQNIQATPSAIQPIIQQVSQVMKDLPSGPPVRRKKHKGLKFSDIYVTRSLSIDKRLVAAFDDFMESGDTKTQIANQVVLKILLEAGYNIDPDILSKPIIKSEPN
jgi:hypothetical protein